MEIEVNSRAVFRGENELIGKFKTAADDAINISEQVKEDTKFLLIRWIVHVH